MIVIDRNHPLADTIALGDLFPFEEGRYRLLVELEYFYHRKRYVATTEEIFFDAPIIPKSYIY